MKCNAWREKILNTLAVIDAEIEFADDIGSTNITKVLKSLQDISSEIKDVYKSIDSTRNLVHGSNLLIIGPTNAGKSSFFNFLLQENKMIISSTKGTTTDQSEQSIEINGKKVNIIDTAGIRGSKRKVEEMGVAKNFYAKSLTNDSINLR